MDRRKVLLVAAVLMAVVGAGLVLLYVQDAEDRAADSLDTVTVLVATDPIALGESFADVVQKGKLGQAQVPTDQLLEGYISDTDDLTGSFARLPISPGEQLVNSKFGEVPSLPLPEGTTAIMLDVPDAARLSSLSQPGQRVSLFEVPSDVGAVESAGSTLLLRDVLILTVGSQSIIPGGPTDIDGQPVVDIPDNLVTVAVANDQVENVIDVENSAESSITFAIVDNESTDPPAGDGTE